MNFLAHVWLSGNDDLLAIGNFIGDSVKGKQYLNFNPRIQQGILLHRAIDDFTDKHPLTRESVSLLFPKHGHYSRVVVDMFYDHFLAAHWGQFSTVELPVFAEQFYDKLMASQEILPHSVQKMLPYIVQYNWFVKYATVKGLEEILRQMSTRTKYESNLEKSVTTLQEHYAFFEKNFFEFMVDIKQFVDHRIASTH